MINLVSLHLPLPAGGTCNNFNWFEWTFALILLSYFDIRRRTCWTSLVTEICAPACSSLLQIYGCCAYKQEVPATWTFQLLGLITKFGFSEAKKTKEGETVLLVGGAFSNELCTHPHYYSARVAQSRDKQWVHFWLSVRPHLTVVGLWSRNHLITIEFHILNTREHQSDHEPAV